MIRGWGLRVGQYWAEKPILHEAGYSTIYKIQETAAELIESKVVI